MTLLTPSEFSDCLDSDNDLLIEVIDGLRGQPFLWDESGYDAKKEMLKEAGITLVTKVDIKAIGGLLPKNVEPVGSIFFPVLAGYADVYVLECQVWMLE